MYPRELCREEMKNMPRYLQGLSALTAKRDELAGRIRAALDAALFQGRLDAAELRQLTDEAQHFLIEAKSQLR